MDVVFIALALYFLEPLSAVVYVLLEQSALIDPDYRGYVVLALAVFSLLRKHFINSKE